VRCLFLDLTAHQAQDLGEEAARLWATIVEKVGKEHLPPQEQDPTVVVITVSLMAKLATTDKIETWTNDVHMWLGTLRHQALFDAGVTGSVNIPAALYEGKGLQKKLQGATQKGLTWVRRTRRLAVQCALGHIKQALLLIEGETATPFPLGGVLLCGQVDKRLRMSSTAECKAACARAGLDTKDALGKEMKLLEAAESDDEITGIGVRARQELSIGQQALFDYKGAPPCGLSDSSKEVQALDEWFKKDCAGQCHFFRTFSECSRTHENPTTHHPHAHELSHACLARDLSCQQQTRPARFFNASSSAWN